MADELMPRRGIVKVAIPMLADLFGRDVKVDGITLTTEDVVNGTLTVFVTGHPTLPALAPGEPIPLVFPVITQMEHGERTTEFRSSPPLTH